MRKKTRSRGTACGRQVYILQTKQTSKTRFKRALLRNLMAASSSSGSFPLLNDLFIEFRAFLLGAFIHRATISNPTERVQSFNVSISILSLDTWFRFDGFDEVFPSPLKYLQNICNPMILRILLDLIECSKILVSRLKLDTCRIQIVSRGSLELWLFNWYTN